MTSYTYVFSPLNHMKQIVCRVRGVGPFAAGEEERLLTQGLRSFTDDSGLPPFDELPPYVVVAVEEGEEW